MVIRILLSAAKEITSAIPLLQSRPAKLLKEDAPAYNTSLSLIPEGRILWHLP